MSGLKQALKSRLRLDNVKHTTRSASDGSGAGDKPATNGDLHENGTKNVDQERVDVRSDNALDGSSHQSPVSTDDPAFRSSFYGDSDKAIYEAQMGQLQEQLVTAMIDNQNLQSELKSYREKHKIDHILRDLEYERQKNKQLGNQLKRRRSAKKSRSSEGGDGDGDDDDDDDIDGDGRDRGEWVDVAQEAVEDAEFTDEVSLPVKRGCRERVRDWLVGALYELMSDFTEDPEPDHLQDKEAEQLTVKKLKDNIKRFKSGVKPIYRTMKGIYATLTWRNPLSTLVAFTIYMYAVWNGWLLPLILFLFIFRLFVNYLRLRGWNINLRYFSEPEEEPNKESEAFRDLGVSDKFNLVLQVAKQVQNTLGKIADNLEKLKSLLTWQQPEATLRLFVVLCVGLTLSCLMPGKTLFTVGGLYLGFKMFVLEYIYSRFPRFKQRHDTTYKIWQKLPTDADLERRYHRAAIDKHVLGSESPGSSPASPTRRSPGDITESDKSFCDIFDLPYTESPLLGWEGGRRCTLIDKEKSLTSAFKNGKLYLTRSFLCFERSKYPSPKNIMMPLADITAIQKAKPYSWLPGSGMSMVITVVGFERPHLFGAMLNRDEIYNSIFVHGRRIGKPWATNADQSDGSGSLTADGVTADTDRDSLASDSTQTDRLSTSSSTSAATFRMSDLLTEDVAVLEDEI